MLINLSSPSVFYCMPCRGGVTAIKCIIVSSLGAHSVHKRPKMWSHFVPPKTFLFLNYQDTNANVSFRFFCSVRSSVTHPTSANLSSPTSIHRTSSYRFKPNLFAFSFRICSRRLVRIRYLHLERYSYYFWETKQTRLYKLPHIISSDKFALNPNGVTSFVFAVLPAPFLWFFPTPFFLSGPSHWASA